MNGYFCHSDKHITIGDRYMFDYLAVGRGFASSVRAGLSASQQDKAISIIDTRSSHTGGNTYDQSVTSSSGSSTRSNAAQTHIQEAS